MSEKRVVVWKLTMLVSVLCEGWPRTSPSIRGSAGSPSGSQFSKTSESWDTWLKPSCPPGGSQCTDWAKTCALKSVAEIRANTPRRCTPPLLIEGTLVAHVPEFPLERG